MGCIAFSPLGQGLLTDKYINGVPPQSRASSEGSFETDFLNQVNLNRVRALNAIATARRQSLAQMAIAWVLRDPRVTGALIGARSPTRQLARCPEQSRFHVRRVEGDRPLRAGWRNRPLEGSARIIASPRCPH